MDNGTVQLNIRIPTRIKHKMEAEGLNQTATIVHLLDLYLMRRNKKDKIRARLHSLDEERAVLVAQLEDIDDRERSKMSSDGIVDIARVMLVRGWGRQFRWDLGDDFNRGWLDGESENVQLAGFGDSEECLCWLKDGFPGLDAVSDWLEKNGGKE